LRAHDGDCLVDASLYTLRLRNDLEVFVDVYGLDSTEIEALGKFLKSTFKFLSPNLIKAHSKTKTQSRY
jgi:hypothetical protein